MRHFPFLWDEWNPYQIYIMALHDAEVKRS